MHFPVQFPPLFYAALFKASRNRFLVRLVLKDRTRTINPPSRFTELPFASCFCPDKSLLAFHIEFIGCATPFLFFSFSSFPNRPAFATRNKEPRDKFIHLPDSIVAKGRKGRRGGGRGKEETIGIGITNAGRLIDSLLRRPFSSPVHASITITC